MKRDSGKKQLSDIVGKLTDDIQSRSDTDLRLIAKRLRGLTTTNCWWVEYELRDVLLSYIENEIAWRSSKNRSAGQKARRAKGRAS